MRVPPLSAESHCPPGHGQGDPAYGLIHDVSRRRLSLYADRFAGRGFVSEAVHRWLLGLVNVGTIVSADVDQDRADDLAAEFETLLNRRLLTGCSDDSRQSRPW